MDPKIKADLDTVCQAQGGVPGYAEKRDYESYTFEVNCIAGKGTKAEKDVTGEVSCDKRGAVAQLRVTFSDHQLL